MSNEPRTLQEAVIYFSEADRALQTMVELRWPTGVCCPTCGRVDVRFIKTRRMWECKETHPKRQFSAKVGTIFEDSALGLGKWFVAIWMLANCKNGISSYELGRAIGITQKSAWHMLHRIRLAMETGSFIKSGGPGAEFEADESFIGGLSKNMHRRRRAKAISGSGRKDKATVFGLLRRGKEEAPSQVVALHVEKASRKVLHAEIKSKVEPGSAIYTDSHTGYLGLSGSYVHEIVDHSVQYVRDNVHTNGLENFWSLLKRAVKGTYVSIEPFHLNAYVVEQTFRFNERKGNDGDRFRKTLANVTGKRLTYKELTENARTGAA